MPTQEEIDLVKPYEPSEEDKQKLSELKKERNEKIKELEKMNKSDNQRLEYLSDNIRKGIPVSISEAIEVIEYQEELRIKRRKQSFLKRLFKKCRFSYGK